MKTLLPFLVCFTSIAADSWTRFRGPNGTGVLDLDRVPDNIASNVLWQVQVPVGKSSPVLAGPKLFLTAWEKDQRLLLCLDRQTGRELWRRTLVKSRTQTMNPLNDAAAPTPVTDGENVYAFFTEYGLISYDSKGNERWRTPLGPFSSVHGVASSPFYFNQKIILPIEESSRAELYAFEAATGKQIWKSGLASIGQQGHSTPVIHRNKKGEAEIIMTRPGEVGGWSEETGEPIWRVRGTGSEAHASPAYDGETVYAYASGDTPENGMKLFEDTLRNKGRTAERTLRVKQDWPNDAMERLDRTYGNNDGLVDEKEWQLFIKNNSARSFVGVKTNGVGDVTETHVLWRVSRGLARVATPLCYRSILFYIRDGGIFTSADPATGKAFKEARLEGVNETFYASPIATDGKVILLSERGKLVVLQAANEWKVLSVTALDEDAYATPALSEDGKMYVRTVNSLRCFGSK